MVKISDDSGELAHVGVSETLVVITISVRYDIQKIQTNSERSIPKFEVNKFKIS
jgi:hypothetical protein